MAPGQVANGQNIQQFLQSAPPGMVMKPISVTSGNQPALSKAGQAATTSSTPLAQPQFSAAQPNLMYTVRGANGPIALRPMSTPSGSIMLNNQLLNLVPVNMPSNVQYHVSHAGATLGLQEMHPPPPTLSPNLVPPTSSSPKPAPNSNNKKKKIGEFFHNKDSHTVAHYFNP
jgi:hypothetical protein